jgi:O-antigen biosynthesis protein
VSQDMSQLIQQKLARSRYYFSLLKGGFSVIFNEGWSNFWPRLKKRIRIRADSDKLYTQWIILNEPTLEVLDRQKQESVSLTYRPKILLLSIMSVLEAKYIRDSINSIRNQTYTNWELWLVCLDGDNLPAIEVMLGGIEKDSRFKIVLREKLKDVSSTSNDFIGLLDQRAELAPFALFEIARTLNEKPDLDFIYSDEDKIELSRKRVAPFFKPDWSPDMFLSYMYTGCLNVFRKDLIESIGGFKSEYDRHMEYDLVLRAIEKTNKIYHISNVLCHQKTSGKSVALDTSKFLQYQIKALRSYLQRNNIPGDVRDGLWQGAYRLKREIKGSPLVSIIIPTKNNIKILHRCMDSIFKKTDYFNYEILVVDNQSTQSQELLSYYAELEKLPNIRIIEYNLPFNFASLNNYAVSQANGDHVLFLNSDIEVISREWLSAMLEHSQRNEVGAVGAKLLFPDGLIQHCGVILGLGTVAAHPYRMYSNRPGYFGWVDIIHNVSAVTAACMMVKKQIFQEIGGFDENLAIDYNDVDFCIRLREKGYLIVYTPYAQLYHLESYIRGYADTPEKRKRRLKEIEYFNSKWGPLIEKGDPYYNPNLSLTRLDFAVDPKPRRRNL